MGTPRVVMTCLALFLAIGVTLALWSSANDGLSPPSDTQRDYSGKLAVFSGAEGFGVDTPAGRGDFHGIEDLADCPVGVKPLTLRPAGEVQAWVLETAGAWPAQRDAVDTRVVANVLAGTGGIIDSQDEAGGFPSAATAQRPLTLPGDPGGDSDQDGYTNVEEWLHGLAGEAEGRTDRAQPG